MTARIHIKDQCLEEGCQNLGGLSLLCAEHAPQYQAALSDPLTHGIGIIGPDGQHIATQDFFAPETKP